MTLSPVPDLSPYHQEMGRLALEVASETAERILLYAEADEADGVTADIFYTDDEPDTVHYRLAPPMLEAVIEAFHDAARLSDPKGEWRTMTYVLADGEFRIELKYEDDLDEHQDISDRRPAVVSAVFGDAGLVDYSRPGI